MAQDLARVATGVFGELGEQVRALLLVGPFARAEGGFVLQDGEPLAVPGYDLIALTPRKPERHTRALTAMAATWSRLLFTRVRLRALAIADLARAPRTRFWYHVGRGHVLTLAGDPQLAARAPRYESSQLRPDAGQLVVCEALTALALANLEHVDDAAAIGHTHRAVAACGDGLLLDRRAYAPNFEQRMLRLKQVLAPSALRSAYEQAMLYASRPDEWRPPSGNASGWLGATRRGLAEWHLAHERQRVGTPLDVLSYVSRTEPLLERAYDGIDSRLRTALRSLPMISGTGLAPSLTDPVERLLRAATALAYRPHDAAVRAAASTLLRLARPQPADRTLARALRSLATRAFPADLGRPFSDWDEPRDR
ncbi:MAG: hypothetical protein PVI30_01090 [Myxococcales bacterium]